MKVRYSGNYGFPGTSFEDMAEFDDDTDLETVEDTIRELVMQKVDWWWEVEEGSY